MKFEVKLEQGKMTESEVRAKLEKAAATARNVAAQKGEREPTQDAMRRQMEKHAEQDKKEGKI